MSAKAWRTRRSGLRGRCHSNIHRRRVLAVVRGVFDPRWYGKPGPVPAQYCTRCATVLQQFGYFTPEEET